MDYSADLRARLTSAVDNGRIDNWRVALDGFDENPLHGTGAGTYRITWDRDRPPPPVKVNDGHSLYLETLSELGRGRARAARGRARDAAGRRRAAPARARAPRPRRVRRRRGDALRCTPRSTGTGRCPRCSCGSSARAASRWRRARARAGSASSAARRAWSPRWPCSCSAITPALFALSQPPLDRAVDGVRAARLPRPAIDAALTATERFGTRPEPWQILGYCDARLGEYALARRAMDAARSRDPDNWQLAYGQAIVYGVSGLDPRPVRRRGAAAEPARPARPGAGTRPRAAQRPRPAGDRSPAGRDSRCDRS